ncbi:MAG: pyridoxal 5'-phosphate synthase glutaminase subunit PdxT [Calditrichaeota bacterium]|nr:pyridoxal 5'-phosphate synthase glutaminase subunit PdxT [Calditrichota bacterium]
MKQTIGVLSLQGDFLKHKTAIENCGHRALYVKDRETLQKCDKLIIPGGESTTQLLLIDKLGLREALIEFGKNKAVMGTCAGLIILGNTREHLPSDPLRLIDIKVKRNAYGRQVDSFIDKIQLDLNGKRAEFEGVFIRAPKIMDLGKDVKPLGYLGKDIVLAANKHILVATFHPELTDNPVIHRFFIEHFA